MHTCASSAAGAALPSSCSISKKLRNAPRRKLSGSSSSARPAADSGLLAMDDASASASAPVPVGAAGAPSPNDSCAVTAVRNATNSSQWLCSGPATQPSSSTSSCFHCM